MTSEEWTTCLVCAAPAESQGREFGVAGVGFEGQCIVVWFQHWSCAAGHRYQVELYEEDADTELHDEEDC